MHTIKITPNLLFEYQCTSGKFIRLPNRIESKLFLRELECSSLSYSFELDLLEKYSTDLRRSSPAGRPTGVDDCCEIWLRSVKGRCHVNNFLSFSDIFRQNGSYFCHAGFDLLYSCGIVVHWLRIVKLLRKYM